jgi:glucose-6-phosphate isomerase
MVMGPESLHEALREAADALRETSVVSLFAEAADRHNRFLLCAAGLTLDFSKHRLDDSAWQLLLELADTTALPEAFRALVAGEEVNQSERRPALHTLLRGTGSSFQTERAAAVQDTLARMERLVEAVHSGDRSGWTGLPFTDVVNLGIGGSDLGPRLVCDALKSPDQTIRAHFVANIDPEDLDRTLALLNPEQTLFVMCSKSFNTEETLSNALRARNWLAQAGAAPEEAAGHMIAVTANTEAALRFGVEAESCFPIWDWVGGRYSLWSAVGLSIPLATGWAVFRQLLEGARVLDEHTLEAAPGENLPMILALLELWHTLYAGADSHVLLPYAHALRFLPDFLQQLTMESNGKRVTSAGTPLAHHSAPILWGSAGTVGQHSYYQLLHQGTRSFTADIILPLVSGSGDDDARRALAAHGLAQSQAFLTGRDATAAAQIAEQRGLDSEESAQLVLPGNHSHSLILLERLDAATLGALIATYEHKTYFLGRLLGINSFDQWGVELGKEISAQLNGFLEHGTSEAHIDDSTRRAALAWRKANTRET